MATEAPHRGIEHAAALIKQGSYDEAVELYRPLVNQGTESMRGQARYGLAVAFAQLGQEQNALRTLEGVVADSTTALGRAVGDLRGRLILQLAEKALHEEGTEAARTWLQQYARLTVSPDATRFARLSEAVRNGTLIANADMRVGVLLPLSGRMARVGQDLLDAMTMAVLTDLDWQGVRVELRPYDTGRLGAEAAANMALNDGADILVGPLVSKDVEAIAPLARSARVPVLGFSSDRGATQRGVWMANYLAAEQGAAMADYAKASRLDRVAGLVPSNAYGYEMFDAFKQQAARAGVDIVRTAFYNPDNIDIGATIRTLVGSVSATDVPFQAVFMPSSASALPLILSQFAYYDLDKAGLAFLGTALWQDPALLSPSIANTARGATFAAPRQGASFTTTFSDTYERTPLSLALAGYDVGRWLNELAFERARTGQGLADILVRPEGFYGHGGFAKFWNNGQSSRGLSIVRVGNGQFDVVREGLVMAPLPVPANLTPSAAGRGGGWFW